MVLRVLALTGAVPPALLFLPACSAFEGGCEVRHLRVYPPDAHWFLEGAPIDGEVGDVTLGVTVTNLETGGTVTDAAALVPFEDGGWGFSVDSVYHGTSWPFRAPFGPDCGSPYQAVVTFALTLADDWPPELLEARPPIPVTFTRDPFETRTADLCLWDDWCVETQLYPGRY